MERGREQGDGKRGRKERSRKGRGELLIGSQIKEAPLN